MQNWHSVGTLQTVAKAKDRCQLLFRAALNRNAGTVGTVSIARATCFVAPGNKPPDNNSFLV